MKIIKNTLGHDNQSEILTIIARMRENKFSIISIDANTILFEIKLVYTITVPVPNTTYIKIEYKITRNKNEEFILHQINGIEPRKISFTDGYIIWSLLEEKILL